MFDYNQIVQNRQRHEAIAKRANQPEPEGWTHPVPNVFDKLFAALKRPAQAQVTVEPKPTVTTQRLATK